MSILEAESDRGLISRIRSVGVFFQSDDGIEEYVDVGLEQSNTERAEKIASRVRDNGIRRYGPMWAEYDGLVKDGRKVSLQASDEALVVDIASTGRGDMNVQIRWDRQQKIVNTFEIRDPDHNNQLVTYYQVSPQSEYFPKVLSRFELSRNFASMLGLIEEAGHSPLRGVLDR
jgi:hypothetical protein